MKTTLLRLVFAILCLWTCRASAQAPIINSFIPASGYIGTSVTISGSNFNPNVASNIVYFGPVRALVNSASAATLVVTAPAGAASGPVSVTTGGLTAVSKTPFIVTFPSSGRIQFDGVADFSTGNVQPRTVAVGDLDGDGKPDLVTTTVFPNNGNAVGGLLIYHNTSTTGGVEKLTFDVPLPLYPSFGNSTHYPGAVVVTDLDGDGKLDLVFQESDIGLVIYRNVGTTGTLEPQSFASPVIINLVSPMTLGHTLAVADMDGDGRPDLIVCRYGMISILRNLSSPGTLALSSFADPFDFPVPQNVYSVVAADFDLDGRIDLASLSGVSGDSVTLCRNISSGPGINSSTLDSPSLISLQANSLEPLVADMDGDGRLDIVTRYSGSESQTVAILRNTTSGPGLTSSSFGPAVEIPSPGAFANDLAIGDLNGDGRLDIVLIRPANLGNAPGSYSVLINSNSPGVITNTLFSSPPPFIVSSDYIPYTLITADVNGDGRTDVVLVRTANNGEIRPMET